jgi:hypothetical protein
MVRPLILSKFFHIDPNDIQRFEVRYKDISNWISFDYRESFEDIIFLASIIELRSKIETRLIRRDYKDDSKSI